MPCAPAPLFRDPIHDGAADPTIIWNRREHAWWIVYTSRRANVDCPGVAWCHGTHVGIAESRDAGQTWVYRGMLQGLEIEPGVNSFWAPEVIEHAGTYHLYVSYVRGVPHEWTGGREILHYTSGDLWTWHFHSRLGLSSDRVIDPCVHRAPDGQWRMWYKDEANGSHTYAADSADLYHWRVVGPAVVDCAHEGPNVFQWCGRYWMVTDTWDGLAVYSSENAETWTRRETILGQPGNRPDDGGRGSHADVLVQGERAYVFYFTHPERCKELPGPVQGVMPYAHRRSSLQVAELHCVDGRLMCDRDAPFEFALANGV